MRIVDVNILLYAIDETSIHHDTVVERWQSLLNGDESVGIPWIVLSGFLRLTTNARLFESALDAVAAFDFINGWLIRSNVFIPLEKPAHIDTLKGLIVSAGTAGNLVADAHLAAFGMTYDATVLSCDHDFKRFRGVRVENPLDGRGH